MKQEDKATLAVGTTLYHRLWGPVKYTASCRRLELRMGSENNLFVENRDQVIVSIPLGDIESTDIEADRRDFDARR